LGAGGNVRKQKKGRCNKDTNGQSEITKKRGPKADERGGMARLLNAN